MRAIGLLCLVVLAAFTTGLKIQCDHEIVHWTHGTFYSCCGYLISSSYPTAVTEIRGSPKTGHLEGKSDADVMAFEMNRERYEYQALTTIPKGFGNFIGNLEYFAWTRGSVASIDSSVFKQLPNLLNITLNHNKITALPSDLFQYTRKLRVIDFCSNTSHTIYLLGWPTWHL